MLFAPTLADKAILPRAWGGRYFFNRIGRFPPVAADWRISPPVDQSLSGGAN